MHTILLWDKGSRPPKSSVMGFYSINIIYLRISPPPRMCVVFIDTCMFTYMQMLEIDIS